jgi:multidrug transporter EmrE-like cation transporter
MYAGVAVYLFDEDKLRLSHMLSLGMILLGLLMLIARSDRIPERRQRRVAGND